MRLWHFLLLSYLPKSQLLSQKREIDLIWKDIKNGKQTNHILINYIWEYEDFKDRIKSYYLLLEKEFKKRNFKFNNNCFELGKAYVIYDNPFPIHHNFRYLTQCYMNLQEKFDRGQKDFSKEKYDKLEEFVRKETNYGKN